MLIGNSCNTQLRSPVLVLPVSFGKLYTSFKEKGQFPYSFLDITLTISKLLS